jgi:aryl-alcohol dehydrogenase-like predicted oxidoreductase
MQYRNLGKSNLKVSALCLGTMMFGDQTARDEAALIVADAASHGVNYIDTADVYTKGASETMLGDLLKGSRHGWVLATKLGNKMSDRVNEGHYSRGWMMREVEASLQRLRSTPCCRRAKSGIGVCQIFAAGALPRQSIWPGKLACPRPWCASRITTC